MGYPAQVLDWGATSERGMYYEEIDYEDFGRLYARSIRSTHLVHTLTVPPSVTDSLWPVTSLQV